MVFDQVQADENASFLFDSTAFLSRLQAFPRPPVNMGRTEQARSRTPWYVPLMSVRRITRLTVL